MKSKGLCLSVLLIGCLGFPRVAGAEEQYLFALLAEDGAHQRSRLVGLLIKADEGTEHRVECRAVAIEPGGATRELKLADALDSSRDNGSRLKLHGLYAVNKAFFDRGAKSLESLDKSLDAPRPADGANVLLVVRGLEPWFQPPGQAPDWIWERLGLKSLLRN